MTSALVWDALICPVWREIKSWSKGCEGSSVTTFVWYAGSPGFYPQDRIKLAWWRKPAILALDSWRQED